METAPTILGEMPRKQKIESDFGPRLLALRKARGLTQEQLAEATGSTQRAISSYETQASYPPAPVLAELAQGLSVTIDELMGAKKPPKALQQPMDAETRRLWKKFQQVMSLPERDQRAVMRLLNSLVAAKGNGRR
jgi:transcriptional regulator with XRE-family HTH domain